MATASFYVEIANEIFVVNENWERPQFIIDRYERTTLDNKNDFYKKLLDALPQNAAYNTWLMKKNEPVIVKAAVNGRILKINRNSKGGELFIVIEHYLKSNKPRPDENATDFEKLEYVYSSNYMELGNPVTWHRRLNSYAIDEDNVLNRIVPYLAEDFNCEAIPDRNFFADFRKQENDIVEKEEVIVVYEDFTIPHELKVLNKIYEIAKLYCEKKLAEINIVTPGVNGKQVGTIVPDEKKPNKTSLMKQKYLIDIWVTDKSMYHKVMKALLTITIENGSNIVEKKEDGNYYWLPVPSSKKWQRYLAAFIHEMEIEKLINRQEYNGSIPVLMEILKRTFKIPNLSKDSFDDLKDSEEKAYSDFKKPFKNMLREIKSK